MFRYNFFIFHNSILTHGAKRFHVSKRIVRSILVLHLSENIFFKTNNNKKINIYYFIEITDYQLPL